MSHLLAYICLWIATIGYLGLTGWVLYHWFGGDWFPNPGAWIFVPFGFGGIAFFLMGGLDA